MQKKRFCIYAFHAFKHINKWKKTYTDTRTDIIWLSFLPHHSSYSITQLESSTDIKELKSEQCIIDFMEKNTLLIKLLWCPFAVRSRDLLFSLSCNRVVADCCLLYYAFLWIYWWGYYNLVLSRKRMSFGLLCVRVSKM